MNGREFERFARQHLLPSLDGFKVKGRLLFAAPVGDVLRAVALDLSGSSGFYAAAFVQPLYVPVEHLTLTVGRRLRSGTYLFGTEGDEEATAHDLLDAIREQGLFILDSLGTLEAFAERTTSIVDVRNLRVREALAYTRAALGEDAEASELLSELEREARAVTERSPWAAQVEENARQLRTAIGTGDARRLLGEWRTYTLTHLRLIDYALDNAEVGTEPSR